MKTKDKTLIANARLKECEYREIEELARKHGTTRSRIVRALIIHSLNQRMK